MYGESVGQISMNQRHHMWYGRPPLSINCHHNYYICEGVTHNMTWASPPCYMWTFDHCHMLPWVWHTKCKITAGHRSISVHLSRLTAHFSKWSVIMSWRLHGAVLYTAALHIAAHCTVYSQPLTLIDVVPDECSLQLYSLLLATRPLLWLPPAVAF